MRTMYDSTTVADIPASAQMVAGYANGSFANLPALRARFPHAVIVSIAVNISADAMVLDVEKGDATPEQAPAWCQRQRARGQVPTVYCMESAWAAVRNAFQVQRVPEPQYWIAHYDNKAVLPAGAVAKQYGGDLPGHYDLSVVADFWPGVDSVVAPKPPAPAPRPALPAIHQEDDMPLGTDINDDRNAQIRSWCWTFWGHGPTPDEQKILLYNFATKGADLTLAAITDHPHAQEFRAHHKV